MNEWIEEVIGEGGAFARVCDDYEYRPQQIDMAHAVAEALETERHCLVEAGTGVGKTIAYLLPAIKRSLGGKPIIVSTHTIALQEQLVRKDIPLMQKALQDIPFKAALVKGRSNYLCLWELDRAREDITFHGDPLFEKVLRWVGATETGDVSELGFSFPAWGEICSNQDTCRHQQCEYCDRCFYYAMRRQAQSADIIVVNHSLFLSDLAIRTLDPRSAILPDYAAVIFDEAHNLEDVASKTFGIEFSNYRVPAILNRIRKRHDIAVTASELEFIDSANKRLFALFKEVAKPEFFFEEAATGGRGLKITKAAEELASLVDGLNMQLSEQDTEGNETLARRIEGFRRTLTGIREDLNNLFLREIDNYFKWCEKPPSGRFVSCILRLTPIDVSQALNGALWSTVPSAVLTSATLSTSGRFNYIKSRLGITSDTIELILGSPFDYESQVLLYVPNDLDFPSEDPDYTEQIADRIEQILECSGGRAFLLFTSYRMLNAVYDILKDRLPYKLLKQGDKSNEKLVDEFRKSESACIFGVHSFWEGVDVKGSALSCVVIDKLPFSVPDSPINRARCDAITSSGGDWFRDYAIPQAQIRLKQGFGRLIRTKTDRGVVAILDSRLIKKSYGREFLRYLPRSRGTSDIEEVRDFFARNC